MAQDKEMETGFHVVVLVSFTVMCALLDVIIVISDWGAWALLPVTLSVLLCWCIHFLDIGKAGLRLYFYVIVMLCVLGYYGGKGQSITDVPILLCLLIILLSRQNDKKLVILVAVSYLAYIFESIFFVHFLEPGTEQIVYSRIALGIFCLFFATVISLYFMSIYQKDSGEKEALRKEVDEAHEETKRFLSNMSHELRTPINVVSGISELMLSEKRSDEDRKNLNAIFRAGRRMRREVSDILNYSELQSGYFKLSEEEYEILSVVNDSVGMVFGSKQMDLDFAIDIDPDIPRVLLGDAKRIRKLIVILLDNAVKFTEVGGGYIYVSKRDTDYGINLNIDIRDTGKGMNPKELSKYREGVYAGDTNTDRKKGGLGLGLYIAHGIVTSMQGFMSMKSSEEGTNVHLTLPQKVIDKTPSIAIENVGGYRALCWFDRKKYVRYEVGEYYYRVVDHVVKDIGVNVEIASSIDNLKELVSHGKITHIFIAQREYETDPDFFEKKAKQIWVCIFAGPDFSLKEGSHITVIPKPVFLLSVVDFLKKTSPGSKTMSLSETSDDQEFTVSGKVHALVVDDEKMNIMVARGILGKMGVMVSEANSGREAKDLCAVNDFDIIFMDHMMPLQNGTDAMKEIRRIRNGFYSKRPIVVLTANAVSGAREGFLAEGFDEFLPKPVGIKEMARCIKKLTGGSYE